LSNSKEEEQHIEKQQQHKDEVKGKHYKKEHKQQLEQLKEAKQFHKKGVEQQHKK
jgi:hypothetical protein